MSHLYTSQTKGDMGEAARSFTLKEGGSTKRKRDEADTEAYRKAVKSAFKFKGGESITGAKSEKKKKIKKDKEKKQVGADPNDFFHAPVEVDVSEAKKRQSEEAALLAEGKSLLRDDRKPAKNLSADYMKAGGKTDGGASQKLNDRIKKKSDRYAR